MDESRREVLKKTVVAAGIVWASPVVQSMTAAASAAGTPQPTTSSTEPASLDCAAPCTTCFSTGCPPASSLCEPSGLCLCSQTHEGDCFCAFDAFGSGPCTTSDDCLANERCMNICGNNCDPNAKWCLPACDSVGDVQVTSTRPGRPSLAA
jgi:hypothetical protein